MLTSSSFSSLLSSPSSPMCTLLCTMLLRSRPRCTRSSNSLPWHCMDMAAASTTSQGGCEFNLGGHFGSSGCTYPLAIIECGILIGARPKTICRIKCSICNYSFILSLHRVLECDGCKMMRLFVLNAMWLRREVGISWSNNFVSPRSFVDLNRLYSYMSYSDCTHVFRSVDGQ